VLKQYLESFNLLTDQEIAEFIALAKLKVLDKGAFFIKEGDQCKEVCFLNSGILRSFFSSDQSEEITYCITFPNALSTAYSSFITQKPSQENIQALVRCELLVAKKNDIERLAAGSLNWTRFLKQMAEQQYLELEKRLFLFQKEKAIKRYLDLIDNQPVYVQQIPLQYLASYLGITPRHLSRLRKEILL
jgi:CRP-like cAMP-binding protein